ncbi:hypothetical protein [Streptomyces triticisoli]
MGAQRRLGLVHRLLRVPDRIALSGIVHVLLKGVAWRDVPAPGSWTVPA